MSNYQDLIASLRDCADGLDECVGVTATYEAKSPQLAMRQAADALSVLTSPIESEGGMIEILAREFERRGYGPTALEIRSISDPRTHRVIFDIAFSAMEVVAARVRASTREGWQPINEATDEDKDGRVVVLGRWMPPWGFVRAFGYWTDVGGISGWVPTGATSEPPGVLGLGTPSHFLRLPTPPQQKQEE